MKPMALLAVTAAAMLGCSGAPDDIENGSEDLTQLAPLHDRAFYAHIAESAGIDVKKGPVVIGLRGVSRNGAFHPTRTQQVFDDVITVLKADGSVLELPASTHPWFSVTTTAPDVDGDGKPDVGMIRPDRYRAVARPSTRDIAGLPTYHVTTTNGSDRLPGWRDTNQDGTYDEHERAVSEKRNDTLGAVLFHQGGSSAPPAIGCQVFSAENTRRFVEAVGRGVSFDYVLVDAPSTP